jgi:hypothetical protein
MGNKPDRDKHTSPVRPMKDPEGGGVAVDPVPTRPWVFDLEDLQPAAQRLVPDVSVRGRRAEPRIQVHAGEPIVGYAPAAISAEIRAALDSSGGGSLLGRVLRVDLPAGVVTVELSLEDR